MTPSPTIMVTNKTVVKPEDFLYIRENGHGVFSISVPPDKIQVFAEALYVLFTLYSHKGRSKALIQIITKEATRELHERPGLLDLLDKHLIELNSGNEHPD